MTALATLASEHDIVEYAEPFNTIALISMVLLLLVYVAGLPATVAVSAVFWRQRTRSRSHPAYAAAHAGRAQETHPPQPADSQSTPPPVAPSPTGPAGQALLHLQDVERQVLALRESPAAADSYVRLATVTADLVARHGDDSTVGRYAAGLRAVVAALAPLHTTGVAPADPPEPPAMATGTLPDRLRVGLARLAAEGRPVPERWAFSWYAYLMDRWPSGTDGRRHEIAEAFTRRYRETYPHGGMIVVLTGRTLMLSYTPASARFGGRPVEVATNLPDVAESPEAVRRLGAVGATALGDLRPPATP